MKSLVLMAGLVAALAGASRIKWLWLLAAVLWWGLYILVPAD